MIFCAKFSLGQFYVAKTRSNGKIVSGQILGKYNKCFAKRRQPKQASFSIGAPSDAEGSHTKSGAPRVLKIFLNIFSSFSLSV